MKKRITVLVLSMLCCISACGNEAVVDEKEKPINKVSEMPDSSDIADEDEEEMEVDAVNRTIIAEALDIEENSRNIRFILSSLNTIKAGQIQSAEAAEIDGEKVINLVAEDGTKYQIYLSARGSVEAVKNLDTGEWPVKSER